METKSLRYVMWTSRDRCGVVVYRRKGNGTCSFAGYLLICKKNSLSDNHFYNWLARLEQRLWLCSIWFAYCTFLQKKIVSMTCSVSAVQWLSASQPHRSFIWFRKTRAMLYVFMPLLSKSLSSLLPLRSFLRQVDQSSRCIQLVPPPFAWSAALSFNILGSSLYGPQFVRHG